ncbi:MAG: DMT family transporter [Alphaproteobacteria bacterium]|nr:DMT family transporter [Alphaproteobacteria bacterium]
MSVSDRVARRLPGLSGPVRGGLWMMAAAFCIVCSTSIARHLAQDMSVGMITFCRFVFGLPFLVPFLVRSGGRGLRTTKLPLHIVRALGGFVGLYLLYLAAKLMPVADVMAILFIRPLAASLLAVFILHEVLTGARVWALVVGFAGILIILRPGFAEMNAGALAAVGVALAGVVTSLAVKVLTRTDRPDTIATYSIGLSVLFSLVPAFFEWQWPTLGQTGWLVLLAFSATLFQRLMPRAHAAADATIVLPFEFTRLPFAALVGLVAFGEFPDEWTWLGGAVIFAAALWMAMRETRAGRGTAPPRIDAEPVR